MTATTTAAVTSNQAATAADISALLRARNPLIWVITKEEARVERYLIQAAGAAAYVARTWDVVQGVADAAGTRISQIGGPDPGQMLDTIRERAEKGGERGVWIMRDLPPWLAAPVGTVQLRQLRNLVRFLPGTPRDAAQAIIVLTTVAEVPPELSGHATVIEWPLPDRPEIAGILDSAINALPEEMQETAAPNGTRDAAIDAAIGLSGEEAAACYARSLVQLRRIDPATVAKEKKRVIARERVLEWYDPIPGGFDAVGGLDNLKDWLNQRKLAFSPQARRYGLPTPRGVVLFGPPGTGKTLAAKAVATAWEVPLLKLDIGALRGKFVGESEQNIRKAFRTIEAMGRCVVLIDEVEKALAGATQGAADGGVSADALSTILSWMSDRGSSTGAFIVATSNDLEALPPELIRAGRFDKIFLVDMPNNVERLEVLRAALREHGRDMSILEKSRLQDIVAATDAFTGSEIAAIVPDALFDAFSDNGREVTVDDIIAAARKVTPLSKTAASKISKLREWAKGKATPATRSLSVSDIRTSTLPSRALDI